MYSMLVIQTILWHTVPIIKSQWQYWNWWNRSASVDSIRFTKFTTVKEQNLAIVKEQTLAIGWRTHTDWTCSDAIIPNKLQCVGQRLTRQGDAESWRSIHAGIWNSPFMISQVFSSVLFIISSVLSSCQNWHEPTWTDCAFYHKRGLSARLIFFSGNS